MYVSVQGGTGAGTRIVTEPKSGWRCDCGPKPASHRNCGRCGRHRPGGN